MLDDESEAPSKSYWMNPQPPETGNLKGKQPRKCYSLSGLQDAEKDKSSKTISRSVICFCLSNDTIALQILPDLRGRNERKMRTTERVREDEDEDN